MADPTIQTFCCHNHNQSDSAVKLMKEFNKESFIVVCMVSSFLGVLGSIYQIFFRKEAHSTAIDSIRTRNVRHLGRRIVIWLAIADLFASSGVFVRSALWQYVEQVLPFEDDTKSVVFCAVSSAWTQYFYTVTWLWTLTYAFDVKRSLTRLPFDDVEKLYHKLIWPTAALLTSIGSTVLYYPDADCHDVHNATTAALRVLPNYLVTYIPILLVMVMNPILYRHSSKEIDRQLIARFSQVTTHERQIMNKFKMKFVMIIAVFYLCWLPNLINGIVLWSSWFRLPVKFVIFNWYIMAITNPLQAFLNALVYRKWDCNFKITETSSNSPIQKRLVKLKSKSGERTPLLTPPRTSTESVAPTMSHINVQQISDEHSVNSCSFV